MRDLFEISLPLISPRSDWPIQEKISDQLESVLLYSYTYERPPIFQKSQMGSESKVPRAVSGRMCSRSFQSQVVAGNSYSLRIPIESILPLVDTNASRVGDGLFIGARSLSEMPG
jgi:hypothetical protein